ncbi:MAG TPA: CsbD family protein [Ramlibacter sp.]|nr:CsbD family protein [Ramlibacter sp.]
MNKQQVKGKLKEAGGKVQERTGRATGNNSQEAKGQAREVEGKAQKKMGDIKQGVKKIVKKP